MRHNPVDLHAGKRVIAGGVMRKFVPVALFFAAGILAFAAEGSSRPPSSSKPVHARTYTRKNGTAGHSYDRALPGTASKRASASRTPSAAKVGKTRAKALSPRKRKQIAKKAAAPLAPR